MSWGTELILLCKRMLKNTIINPGCVSITLLIFEKWPFKQLASSIKVTGPCSLMQRQTGQFSQTQHLQSYTENTVERFAVTKHGDLIVKHLQGNNIGTMVDA